MKYFITRKNTTKRTLRIISKFLIFILFLSSFTFDGIRICNDTFSNTNDNLYAANYSYTYNPKTYKPTNYTSISKGIDVSRWQGDIDWQKVYDAGYRYVFVKVVGRGTSYGSIYLDDYYAKNLKGAAEAGLKVGAYVFSQAITEKEAIEEAKLLLKAVKKYDISYPLVFDWETGYNSDGTPFRSNGAHLSKAKMTKIVTAFLTTVEKAGYEGMVYGNAYDLSLFDVNKIAKNHKIWLACYPAYYRPQNRLFKFGNTTPSELFPYYYWQYKCTGKVPGIKYDVDVIVSFNKKTCKLNLKSNTIYAKKGTKKLNLLDNVTATNSYKKDVTNYVTYTIKNSKGQVVSLETATNTIGKYKVTYQAKYLNEYSKKQTATLYVTNDYTLNLKDYELVTFSDSDSYLTASAHAKNIANKILDNGYSTSSLKSLQNVTLKYSDRIYKNTTTNKKASSITGDARYALIPGKYTVDYYLDTVFGVYYNAELSVTVSSIKSDTLTYNLSDITSDLFVYNLNEDIHNNLTYYNFKIKTEFSEELEELIDKIYNDEISEITPGEYSFKYVIDGEDSNKIYKKCNIIIE